MAQIEPMGSRIRMILFPWLAVLVLSGPAAADEASSRGLELRRLAYLIGVADYCGFVTYEVYDGYQRETRELIRRENLSQNTWRWIRINGSIDADLQYGNHGIAGQRRWCQSDGMEAVMRFIAFRDAQLADEQAADQ